MQGLHLHPQVSPVVAPVLRDTLRREPELVGRSEEVAELLDLLRPTAEPAVPVVVHGMGGIGKTGVALATAHAARRARSFAGYHYLDFHGYEAVPAAPLTPDEAITALLRNLGVGPQDMPPDAAARADRYHALLSEWSDRGDRLLLVADNVSRWEQVRPLLPAGPGHRILVTTRNLPAGVGRVTVKELGLLTSEHAQDLLSSQIGELRFAQDPAARAELAAFCGGLPLALELVAGLLRMEPDLPARQLVEYLAQEQERLDELTQAAEPDRDLRTVFGLSCRQLGADEQRLFALLAIAPGDRTGLPAAAALVGLPLPRTRRLLARLRAANLLTGDATHHGFHDLVRLYAAELAHAGVPVAERTAATDRLLDHYTRTAVAADSHLDPSRPDDPRFAGRAEALDWLRSEWRQLVAATGFAVRNDRAAHGRDLGRAVTTFLDVETHWTELAGVVALRLDAVRRLGDPAGHAAALRSLGVVLANQHRFTESIAAHQEALRIIRTTGDREEKLRSTRALGISLYEAGRYREARQAFTEALAECVELGDRHVQVMVQHDLGLTSSELGEHREAVEHYGRAVQGYREFGDRYREAMVLRCWASTLAEQQDHAGSLARNRESLRLSEEVGDRPGQAAARTNVSLALAALGRPVEALAEGREALRIADELGDPWLTGQVMCNLLATATAHGSRRDHYDVAERVIELYRELGVPERVAIGLFSTGWYHIDGEDVELGIERLSQALEINRATGNRIHEARTLAALGHGYQQLGQVARAVDCYRAAVDVFRAVGDEQELAGAVQLLGNCCFVNDLWDEAISALAEALPLHQRLGQVAQEAENRSAAGLAHLQLRQYDRAGPHLEAAVELFRRLGNGLRAAYLLGTLGDACVRAGRPDDAVAHLTAARAAFRELGERRMEATMAGVLGAIATQTGRLPDAVPLFQDALDTWLALGDDTGTARAQLALAEVADALGDTPEAVRRCELALPLLDRLGETAEAATVRAFLAEQALPDPAAGAAPDRQDTPGRPAIA